MDHKEKDTVYKKEMSSRKRMSGKRIKEQRGRTSPRIPGLRGRHERDT